MDVILGFPFRGVTERKEIFERTKPLVEEMYPFSETVVMDSGHEEFNRAATRNMIAQYAIDAKASVVVICDADSIPQQEVLKETIESTYDHGSLRIPFDRVKVLSYPKFIRKPYSYHTIRPLRMYGPSCGGIYVLRPTFWRALGGMDERIEGWGFEDQILLSASKTFSDGPIFHVGDLYTINHQRDVANLENQKNRSLVDKYHSVEGKIHEFRKISAGSNHFCPDQGKTTKPR